MAPTPSRLPSYASSFCRAAKIVRFQCLERKALKVAATRRSFTSSNRSTQPHSRSSASSSRENSLFPTHPPSAYIRRGYHSYDHPSYANSFCLAERAILAAAYAHVPEHGFSQQSLALGARDSGYLDISTNLLPDGVFNLVQWHMVSQRESLAGRARELFSGERLGTGKKVEVLIWERLMGSKAVIRQWQEVRFYQ